MKQPLKILSIIDIPWNSGLAHYAFEQALALRAGGHQVTFACPEESAAERFAAKEGFPRFAIPGRKQLTKYPAAILGLSRFARTEGFEFACAHTGLSQTVAWFLRNFDQRLKIIRVKADARLPSTGFTFSSVGTPWLLLMLILPANAADTALIRLTIILFPTQFNLTNELRCFWSTRLPTTMSAPP